MKTVNSIVTTYFDSEFLKSLPIFHDLPEIMNGPLKFKAK